MAGPQRLGMFSETGVGVVRFSIPSTCGDLPRLLILGAAVLVS